MHFPFVSSPKSNPHRRQRRGITLPSKPVSISIGGIKPTALPKPTIKPTTIKITTEPAATIKPAATPTLKTSTTKSSSTKSSSSARSSSSSASSTASRATPTPIPAGQPFAGRLEGGGTRDDIFGTRTYGSGYPGIQGRGTAGRGFPFYFWPIAWPAAALVGVDAGVYLSDNNEYGSPTNTTRPGGQLTTVFFTSATIDSSDSSDFSSLPNTPTITNTSQPGMTYRILSDNNTIADLVPHILSSCSSLLSLPDSSNTTEPYTGFGAPHPEQIVQYYRASSIALSMDGYNNSATYNSQVDSNGDDAADTPLPTTADLNLMDCLNQTIGANAPLVDPAHLQNNQVDGAGSLHSAPNLSLAGVVGLLWLLRLFI